MNNHSPRSQKRHDRMVRYIAVDLARSGYTVRADHINWPYGYPPQVNGHIPDIIAVKDDQTFIVEIETCSTLNDPLTMLQLNAFSRTADTYVMIPSACLNPNNENFNPVQTMRRILQGWNLTDTKIGTCNHINGVINYNA